MFNGKGRGAAIVIATVLAVGLLATAFRGRIADALVIEDVPTEVPDFTPPVPSGPHGIGRRQIVLDGKTVAGAPARDLPAWLYYPAANSSATSPMLPAIWTDAYRPLLARRLGDAATTAMLRAPWPIAVDADVAAVNTLFPVVVFSHGSGQLPTNYQALIDDLVSHGYVVLAIVSPGMADIAILPGGEMVPKEGVSDALYATTVADIRFAVQHLPRLNTEAGEPLAQRLDLARVAVVGHSLGGAAAVLALAGDPSAIRTAVHLDGDYGGATAGAGPPSPFLYLTTTPPDSLGTPVAQWDKDRSEKRRNDLWQKISAGTNHACRVRMADALHSNFLDPALLPPASMPASKRKAPYGPIGGGPAP